jgi:isoaspartyl peptidase/L-asparaginase-like protein (Ntn-hydrolase superfamily)
LAFKGTGSPLTSEGDIEMDAVIMDGRTLESGAVAAVKNVKNPIVLARMVMENVCTLNSLMHVITCLIKYAFVQMHSYGGLLLF